MNLSRKSGVLLHISSLASSYGIGDCGPQAFDFVDFLARTGQRYWQVLPMNPTNEVNGHSPYSSPSAFAGNILLISPDRLCDEGLITAEDCAQRPTFFAGRVDFEVVVPYKHDLLEKAFTTALQQGRLQDQAFKDFVQHQQAWLEDYALFVVLKEHYKEKMWTSWPKAFRERQAQSLERFAKRHVEVINKIKFWQFLFFQQWQALRDYAALKRVAFIGDIPIYVNMDSADVWTYPEIFKLDKHLKPYVVAGVPPDYFSKTGQRWGNPVYDWERLKATGYAWWGKRLRFNLGMFDIVRIDHFRGLVDYWEIPAKEMTAIKGHWVPVDTDDFFQAMQAAVFPGEPQKALPIIAEDLGIITDDVRAAMKRLGFPGMKILLFAFGDEGLKHPYLPHNYTSNCVVYSGTHDNNTVEGWFAQDASAAEKKQFFKYFEDQCLQHQGDVNFDLQSAYICWKFIYLAMMSKAQLAMIPMQDILELDHKHRMNIPSTIKGNWSWQMTDQNIDRRYEQYLQEVTKLSGRITT